MRKGKYYSPRVRSAFLLDTLKMQKVVDFFNQIQQKIFLEEMLNLLKISWLASLIWCLCKPSLVYVPCSSISPIFHSTPILVSSSDEDNDDENPPPFSQPPLALAPELPRWVHSTREVVSDLVGGLCTRS
jgi:hypothetical protein